MNSDLLCTISKLRIYVGYLGEKDQFNWWKSSFFTTSSDAFLSPLFSRTKLLAQVNGVTRAASILHDDHIGIGRVYHLFRLPEQLEQGLSETLKNTAFIITVPSILTKPMAFDFLENLASKNKVTSIGPTRVGQVSDIYYYENWQRVAGIYSHAFSHQDVVYPFFSDIS